MKLTQEEYDNLADLLRKVDIDLFCYNKSGEKSKIKYKWHHWTMIPNNKNKHTLLIAIDRNV